MLAKLNVASLVWSVTEQSCIKIYSHPKLLLEAMPIHVDCLWQWLWVCPAFVIIRRRIFSSHFQSSLIELSNAKTSAIVWFNLQSIWFSLKRFNPWIRDLIIVSQCVQTIATYHPNLFVRMRISIFFIDVHISTYVHMYTVNVKRNCTFKKKYKLIKQTQKFQQTSKLSNFFGHFPQVLKVEFGDC